MLKSSYTIGKFRGIPIHLHITLLLVALMNAIAPPNNTSSLLYITFTVMLFLSVLIHEIGHCLVAQFYNLKVKGIILWPLGGLADIEGIGSIEPKKEFLISAAGPATSFALAFIVLYLTGISYDVFGSIPDTKTMSWGNLSLYVIFANVVLGAFNLLPIYPMDGGRMCRSIFTALLGKERGTSIACVISILFAGPILLWSCAAGHMILSFIMGIMLWQATTELSRQTDMTPKDYKRSVDEE